MPERLHRPMNSDFVIRKASKEDAEAIYEIEKESFSLLWSKELFIHEIESEMSDVFCACTGDTAAGFLCLMQVYDELHLTNIAVSRKYRNLGIGSALVEHAKKILNESICDYLYLEVRVSNADALRLYEKSGFRRAGIRKKYYTDNNEDAVIMCCPGVNYEEDS